MAIFVAMHHLNFATPQTPLPCFGSRRLQHLGFTLVELLIVLAVFGVLVSYAAPSLSIVIRSVRLTAAANAYLSSMLLARSEAIKRSGRVVLCKTADGMSCSASGGWEQGWIVFHDSNNSGDHDPGELVIERMGPLSAGVRLSGNSPVANYVSFSATGGTKLVGGGFQAGTLTLCNESTASGNGRQIILNAVGRPRLHTLILRSCG